MTNGHDAAFARPVGMISSEEFSSDSDGLTKREYFAAKALTLWQMDEGDLEQLLSGKTPDHKTVAQFCVEVADALIEALNKDA